MTDRDDFTLETLRDAAAVDALAREWNSLPQAQASPLVAAEWFGAAATILGAPIDALVLRRNGMPSAVAPLGDELRAGVARLQPIGVRDLKEPSSLLYSDAAALDALCDALVAQRRPFILQRVSVRDALRTSLTRAARRRGVLYESTPPSTPVVNFSGDGDVAAFEARLSSRRRQDFRRARRGLERSGPVTFDLRTPTPATLASELDEAIRIEASSWKSRGGTTLLRHPVVGPFYREYARRMAAQGRLRIAFLRVAGVGIAMQLFVEHASRFWIFKIGYDENWAEHSPGVQLMWETMRHACATRVAGVELLGEPEDWLTIWTRESREYRTLIFYPYNFRGVRAAAADAAYELRRRLRRRPA